MGLIMSDPDLLTRPPKTPPAPTKEDAKRPRYWLWASLLVVAIAGGISLGMLLDDGSGSTPRTVVELMPEYEVDTPLVIYEPGFTNASFFSGTDAELDPETSSFHEEYMYDTPLVTYAPEMPTFWVGSSGDIAPEK